jgi:hypothetical protein
MHTTIVLLIGLPEGKRTVEILRIDVWIILKRTPKEWCWEYRLVSIWLRIVTSVESLRTRS